MYEGCELLEDDPAKVAAAEAQPDHLALYGLAGREGYCDRHDSTWYSARAKCEAASAFRNARNVCDVGAGVRNDY
jgi:hypothetical protein